MITRVRTEGDLVVTGAKNGEVKVLELDVYKG